ncbi:MAG: HD-GYP domain-containing protein [Saccharofermentans sp.]|nr:HD-GYP domain-containing protein [Saccharofermentans sp.]
MSTLVDILEYVMLYTAFVFVSKYVFMENSIRGKKRFVFHGAVVVSIITAYLISENLPFFVGVVAFALYILLERRTIRIFRAIIAVPILGVVYGLVLPFIALPEVMLGADSKNANVVKLLLFSIVSILLIVVQFHYDEKRNMDIGSSMSLGRNVRKLSKFEKTALLVVGSFEYIFATLILVPSDELIEETTAEFMLNTITIFFGISTFISTIVLIAVVLSGNKRAYLGDKVADMQFNIIVTMAEIVENRDANTGGHIQRTARYVDIIAKQLKRNSPYSNLMTDQFIHDLSVAAPLHDIGKIHVSDSVLNYPGRLSEEQFQIMKSHAAEGKKLLQHSKMHLGNFSYLDMAIDMAGAHHEWWDGSSKGYPDQLKGEEIPLCARIMAVADVFDALTARRIYKEPMPIEKALSIILSEKGTHFDPVVIDAFLDSMSEIKEALADFEKGYQVNTAVEDKLG